MENIDKTNLNSRPAEEPTDDPDLSSDQLPAPWELDTAPSQATPLALLVDGAVDHINRIYIRKGLEVAIEVGRYVLDTFFDGDSALVADHGKDQPTFRALADRDDLMMSHAAIWRAVRIAVQLPALPEQAATLLPYTHHTLLLPIRDRTTKAELAQAAINDGLTSRDFEARVKEARQAEKTDNRGGRQPLPAFVKTIRKVGRLVADNDLWGDLDHLDELGAEEAGLLYQAVTGMKLKCEELQEALQHRVPGFEPPE
jgi:hypothetical protein